jgi:hypothetical protein
VGDPSGGVFSVGNSNVLTINCSNIVNTVGLGSSDLTYTYTNAAGCSNSRSITGMVVNCASHRNNITTAEQITSTDFILYPNPANFSVNLNIDKITGAGTIIITDLYGKTAKNQTLSMGTNTIDIANLIKGIYFVSIITSEKKITKKLMVE